MESMVMGPVTWRVVFGLACCCPGHVTSRPPFLCLRPPNPSGHPVTIHFVTNDIIMCGHFALAIKEVTPGLQLLSF